MKVCTIALAALFASTGACAGDDFGLGETGPATAPGAPRQGWDVALGAQLRHAPDYLGSRDRSTLLLPMFRVAYGSAIGTFRLGPLPGAETPMLSYSPYDTANASLGVAVGADPGRSEDDAKVFEPGSERLRGMGRISSTAMLGVFGRYRIGAVSAHAMFRRAIDRDRGHGGQIGTLQLSYALPMPERLSASVGAGLNWADQRYTRTMFGVSAAQSAASGFAVYTPDGGVRDYSLSFDLRYRPGQRLVWHAGLALVRLAGDAADSPLAASRSQPRLHVGATYHW